MKTIRKVVLGIIISVPLFLAPSQSKAGDLLGGLLNGLLGGGNGNNGNSSNCQPTPPPNPGGNSAPIDGGTVFLLIAGLGLGAKLMYEKSKQQVENE